MLQPIQPKNAETNAHIYARNGYSIISILIAASLLTGGLFAYLGYATGSPQLFIVPALLTFTLLVDFFLLSLVRAGKVTLAMSFVIALFLINILVVPLFVQGLGIVIAISALIVSIAVTNLTMPPKYSTTGIVVGLVSAASIFLLDANLGAQRLKIPQLEAYVPYIVAGIAAFILVLVIQGYRRFSLRIKIAIGILLTGAVTVSTLAVFGLNRVNANINALSQKFEESVKQQIETEIKNTVQQEASQADALFSETLDSLTALAAYRASLETRQDLFLQGSYWNANENVFQMPDKQYGNSVSDPASIFIPNTRTVDETLLTDLNTTAYLDFVAPNFLATNPQVVALYYVSVYGATTYYPNINLAQNVPADFETTKQVFFTIANAQNNPKREPRWTPPYQDPAGTGLIVTLSIPVYANGAFKGVISADLQLAQLTETLSNIKLGESGFAFLVDSNGRVLAMPPQGYSLFKMQPEIVPVNKSPQQSILDRGASALQATEQQIVSGETGLVNITADNADLYIGFTPLPTSSYRLALVAPADELNDVILSTRSELQNEAENSLRSMLILLTALFVGALVISLWVGQIITNPLVRLTRTVEQISAGDFSARASTDTQDETGILANSFNSMADTLKNTLAGLEGRILERTSDLEKANERNALRAEQFESIARVARTISSTQAIESLLPLITETISAEFNFYHVGIFLLDNRHEYAILVAANSEGGQKMLARNHRLQVGETGIVGYVTNIGQPRVALDVGADAVYFNNPDLPDTHSEVALPLRIGSNIFGALDVQSTEKNAFSQENISILSTLADQVSIAIQNARSYQQSNEALEQAENASYQLSGQQWKRFLTQQTMQGYYFDGIETKAVTPATNKQFENTLSVPLTLRGLKIGAIKFSALDPNREWSDDEIAMIQAAAERTALALENARLLFESQKRAAKERAIGEVSAKIGGLTDFESILQTAIQEIGATLPNVNVAVQFTDEPSKR